jgi:hypothetical protein
MSIDGVLIGDWIYYHFTTQLRTTSNYSTTTNLTLYKSPQHMLSIFQPAGFTSRFLVTASNSGDSSASALKPSLNGSFLPTDPFLHRLPYRIDLVAPIVFLITAWHGTCRQHRSLLYANRLRGNVFIEPFPSGGRLFFPSN